MRKEKIIQIDLIAVLALLVTLSGVGGYQIYQNNYTNTSLAVLVTQQASTNDKLADISENIKALNMGYAGLKEDNTAIRGDMKNLDKRVTKLENRYVLKAY